jgi:hypothetical protein
MRVLGRCSRSLLLVFWLGVSRVVAQPLPPPSGDSPDRPADPPPAAPVSGESPSNPAPEQPGADGSHATVDEPPVAPPVGDSPDRYACPQPPSAPAPDAPTGAPKPPPSAAGAADLTVWASAAWADSIGPGRCKDGKLEGAELAKKLAATLKRSVSGSGIAISAAGALADHPLLSHAARTNPDLLARLFADMGYSAIALGIADLSGPLLRYPALSQALERHGVHVVASNLRCGEQAWCRDWITADDPLLILEQGGQRYAFISILPDDTLTRAEPAASRAIELLPASDTLIAQTERARAAQVDLVIASIDHGLDATAVGTLGRLVTHLPASGQPDLVLSPSAAQGLLFLRPLTVNPAVAGTRAGAVTSVRVRKIGAADADVMTRGVRLQDPDPELSALLQQVGASYCAAEGRVLPGAKLAGDLDADGLVHLAALSARALAGADLVVVDPSVFDAEFSQPAHSQLQHGQVQRAVPLDSRLVVASVTLEWLAALNKQLDGPRPIVLFGAEPDDGSPAIGGRVPIPGARYRIVTSAVLARSGRLPDAGWTALEGENASLRGALLAQLSAARSGDPRDALRDPYDSTQWVLRTDGQLQGNLTSTKNPSNYEEPALQANESRQVGARVVINMDGDAPGFLFENALQIAFDRNFATKTTAQDLDFIESTYTYRGLWPKPLFYPHPFVEGYLETQFAKGDAAYHHLLLRPEIGLRSMFSRVLSLKLSGGFEVEALSPDPKPKPGFGAELVLKPWTFTNGTTSVQMEGNVSYLWISPTELNQHTLRAQLITAIQIIGPLQFTLTALGLVRKDRGGDLGKGASIQAGIRLRFIERMIGE